jgi:membrane-associated phospholipid phosphatase
VLRARLPIALYLLASAVAFVVLGAPTQRDRVWLWLLGGLVVATRGEGLTGVRRLVRDWLPFIAALWLYDLSRAASTHLGIAPHATEQIAVDRALFLGHVPTVELQHALWDPRHLHVWDYAVWALYTSHFLVTLVVAAVLWRRAPELFRRYRAAVVALAFAGVVTFALFPAEPPWMASQHGLVPPVARVTQRAAEAVGQHNAGPLFARGVDLANPVAAVPSLHAAFPALILLFFWVGAPWWRRAALLAYALAVAWVVVYAGEHYVIDVLLGWGYAAGAFGAVRLVARRRAAHRVAAAVPS